MTRARVTRTGLLGTALAGALALAGCSQISALAPVGGDAIAEVRFGAIDVLLAHDVDVLEAPTCTTPDASTTVTCSGSTTTGEPITVTSSTDADAQLEVIVGGRSLYDGPLQEVIDQAARS